MPRYKLPPGPGRPKGSRNKAPAEFSRDCRAFILDKVGLRKLQKQYRDGTIHPSIWLRIEERGFGKVKEQIELTGDDARPMRIVHEFAPGTTEAVQRAIGARTATKAIAGAVAKHVAAKHAAEAAAEEEEDEP